MTNHFSQQPKDPTSNSGDALRENYDLLISGTVEQLKYGAPNEISKYIWEAIAWGPLAVMAQDKHE